MLMNKLFRNKNCVCTDAMHCVSITIIAPYPNSGNIIFVQTQCIAPLQYPQPDGRFRIPQFRATDYPKFLILIAHQGLNIAAGLLRKRE